MYRLPNISTPPASAARPVATIRMINVFLASVLIMFIVLSLGHVASAQTPITNGFRDWDYARSGSLTGEKPESKLWWNDGIWWGSLLNPSTQTYHIYRFQPSAESWQDTGTVIDTRSGSRADTLWDSSTNKLYIVSHFFTKDAVATSSTYYWGKLLRFSYNSTTKSYSLDSGFPVFVTKGKCEALTLAKDSLGTLWITWMESSNILINHSLSSDTQWGSPTELPVSSTATSTNADDISVVTAFDGNKIGVMWSNQNTDTFYFAVHNDGDPDTVWSLETALSGPNMADDHMNIKTLPDGRLFAAVKTSRTSSNDPLTMLLVRAAGGGWSSYTFGLQKNHHTRPIVLLDEEHNQLYMFATSGESGGTIYYKKTSIDNISFPTGLGTPFIKSSTDTSINDASSTKQNLNSTTGLMVVAADVKTQYYFHNNLSLGTSSSPSITSFTPTSGPVGTSVAITGQNLSQTNGVSFNGTSASFSVDSSTQVTATVPLGATNGPITVITPGGNATSSGSFTVTSPNSTPIVSSFSPTSGPVGTSITITGRYFTDASTVSFNGTSATTYTVNSDTQITATVPSGATTGPISVTATGGTGTSTSNYTVTTPVTQTFTLNTIADTFVRGGTYANNNYGTNVTAEVRMSTTADNYRDTYFLFDLTNVNNITSAVVHYYGRMGSTTASALNEVHAEATTDWSETTMTYNNRPAMGDILGSVTVTGSTYAWYDVDVTAYVQAEKAAGHNRVSFVIHGATDPGTYELIETKEWSAANAPKIIVVGTN